MGTINSLNNYSANQRFEEQGYMIVKNMFNPNHITNILTEIQSIFMIQAKNNGVSTGEVDSSMYNLFNSHRKIFKNCGKQAQHLIDVWSLSCDDNLINNILSLSQSIYILKCKSILCGLAFFYVFNTMDQTI